MNNAVIIQQCYPGKGYEPLIELTLKRNQEYADRHCFDLRVFVDSVIDRDVSQGGWAKVELIQQALHSFRNNYKFVIWLDADAVIYDLSADLRDALPDGGIGCAWHVNSLYDHWNVGVIYLRNSERTREFVKTWLSQAPGPDPWHEQDVYNQMAHDPQWADIVRTVDNRWNSTEANAPCDNPVIKAFHGCGPAFDRLQLMKECLR